MTSEQRPFHFRRILSGFALTAVMLALEAAAASNAPPVGGTGPAIASLSPEEGAVGTVVTVTGTNFGPAIGARQGTSGVSFNGVWASPAYWSGTEIRVPVPPGASSGPVVVTVSGQGSSGAGFSVTGSGMAGPSIGTVSPALGAVGTVVTVRGADFGPPIGAAQGASTVSFNGMVGVPAYWSGTEVRAAVPAGVTSGLVVVTVNGAASHGIRFTVTPAGAGRPAIAWVSPEEGAAGTVVTVRGTNFGPSSGAPAGTGGVSFNGVWAWPTSWSETEIRAPVPAGAQSGLVVVTADGAASDGVAFRVSGSAPVIATVNPTFGPEGTWVVIRGENFGSPIGAAQGRSGVSFNGVWTSPSSWSGTEIRVPVPEGVTSGLVEVRVDGAVSNGVEFTVTMAKTRSGGTTVSAATARDEEPGPVITGLDPDEGQEGTLVTVRGRNFGAAAADTSTVSFFNSKRGVPTSWSETEIRVPVPEGTETGSVVVRVDGAVSNGVEFREVVELRIEAGDSIVREPNGETTITVQVSAEDIPSVDDVSFLYGGSALEGVDYTMETLEFMERPGLGRATLTVVNDEEYEGPETIEIRAVAVNYHGDRVVSSTLVIRLEDDDPPPLRLTVEPAVVAEPDGTATLKVSIPEAAVSPTDAVRVTLHRAGTARPGRDYRMRQRMTLRPGRSSKTTKLNVEDDAEYEGEEEVRVYASVAGFKDSPEVTIRLEDDELPPLRLTVEPAVVAEPGGTAVVTVSIPAEAVSKLPIKVGLLPTGTATPGSDYTLAQTVTIPPRQSSAKTRLEVVDDAVYEGEKEVRVYARAAGFEDSAEVVIRLEDDELPPLRLTVEPAVVAEPDGTAVVTVSIPEAAVSLTELVRVTLHRAGTATTGSDYTLAQTVTISARQSAETTRLEVVDDAAYEGEKEVRVYASAAGFKDSPEVVIVLEDDELPPLRLTVEPAVVAEPGGTATLTVSIPGAEVSQTDAVTVTLHPAGPATPGSDYTLAQTVTIPPGRSSATKRLEVVDDAEYEGEEEVRVYASAAGFEDSPEVVIRLEDDELPPLRLTVEPAVVAEPVGTAVVTVSIPEAEVSPTDAVTVTLHATGTATAGSDYTLAQTVTIPSGQSSETTRLEVEDDSRYEPTETILIQATAQGYRPSDMLTITVENDDPPLVTLVCPQSLTESSDPDTVLVLLPKTPDEDTPVEFSFEGTATRGDDYTMVETVTIEAGSKRERPQLTVIDDLIYEGAETILIEASAEGYVTDNCLIQLADNDPETGVTVSPSSLSITEGESGQYQVKLASQPSASVTIAIGSSNGDVQVNPASLTFTTGETGNWNVFQGVTVQVVHDDDSADEQATLTHTASSGDPNYAGIAGPGVSVQITDDDPAGVTVSPTSLSITEGESGQYQVALISQPTAPVAITLTSSNGDLQVPASLTIAPSDWNTAQTVTVQVAHDDDMADETGTITHVASSGDPNYAGIAVDAVSVQITDQVPGVTVTPTRLSITEGKSKSYQARLKTRPSASVTISMSSSNGDVGVPSTPLTFTTATGATGGWDQFQSVTVRIAHDDNTSDESGTITHTAASGDTNYDGIAIDSVSVSVSDDDDPPPPDSLSLSVNPTSIAEAGGTSMVWVSVPTAVGSDLRITLHHPWDGSAESGDYTLADSVTIDAGSTTAAATLTANDDTDDHNETVKVQATAIGYDPSPRRTVTIEDDDPPPEQRPTLSSSRSSVSEPSGTATITVSVPAAVSSTTTFTLEHTGSADNGTDYTVDTLTIENGDDEGTATLRVRDDTDYEGLQKITFRTAQQTGFRGSAPLTIDLNDDDPLPEQTPTLSSSRSSVSEPSGTATITVSVPVAVLSTTTFTLEHTGSADNGTDYTVDTLTIENGDDEGTATLRVRDDTDYEGLQKITFETAQQTGFRGSAPLTIDLNDDDPLPEQTPTLSSSRSSVSEPSGTATITVSVPAAVSSTTTFTLEHTGSADNGTDYTVDTLTIENGDDEGTATLRVRDDTDYEGLQKITFETAQQTGFRGSAPLTIDLNDDDPLPEQRPTLSSSRSSVSEPSGTATITVSVPVAVSSTTTFTLEHTGSADNGTDYTVDTLTIENGDDEGTATLRVRDDTDYEGLQKITFRTAQQTGFHGSAPLTIDLNDDDPLPEQTPTLSSSRSSVSEPSGTATITVSVPAAVSSTTTFTLEHTGSADNGTDYTVDTLTIENGDDEGTATLRVRDDTDYEGLQKITFRTAQQTGFHGSAPLTIDLNDDDPLPEQTPTLSSSRSSVSEPSGTATITVSVPAAVSSTTTFTLEHTGSADNGTDYTVDTLTIENGDDEGTATLRVRDDTDYEGLQKITFRTAQQTGFHGSAPLTIDLNDDDPLPEQTPTLSSSRSSVSEPSGTATITVSVPAAVSSTTTFTLEHTGSADNGTDYTVDTLTIENGDDEGTATLRVRDDTDYEGLQKITFRTAQQTGFHGSAPLTINLNDDDPPPGPIITSIRPGLQRPDDPVTIYGNHFGSTPGSVSFGGHNVGDYNFTGPDSDYSWSNTSISLLIPASAQPETVSVTVTTSAGQTSNSKSYTITGGPLPRPEDECEGEEEDCPDDTKKGGGSNDAEEETDSEESEDSPEDGG